MRSAAIRIGKEQGVLRLSNIIILDLSLPDMARFDNSHSWTKSKKLSYWLELLQPADEEPEFQETLEAVDELNLDD